MVKDGGFGNKSGGSNDDGGKGGTGAMEDESVAVRGCGSGNCRS